MKSLKIENGMNFKKTSETLNVNQPLDIICQKRKKADVMVICTDTLKFVRIPDVLFLVVQH